MPVLPRSLDSIEEAIRSKLDMTAWERSMLAERAERATTQRIAEQISKLGVVSL